MAVDVGNLLVRVGADISDMQRKLDQVEREVSKTSQQVSKSAKAMDVAFQAAALAGVAIAAKRFVDLGAAVEETASKFRTVMGPATQEVQTYLDGFANAAGLSNEQAQGLVATSASIAQGMGFAQESAARFSTEILTLSADLASFNNLPTEEVINAVNSALAGEREQLKRLGIVIREADVQQRAMAESGKESAAALTLQEKATATLQLITERAGVAVGDLERTQDSLANQTKQAAARVEDMRNALAGVVAEGIQASGVIVELNEVFSQIRGSGSTAAAAVKAFFEPIAEFLQDVEEAVIALRGLKNAFVALSEFTKVGLRQAFENFQEAIEASEREIADARAEFERRRDITEDTAAAENEVANAAERAADAMERAANAQARVVEFSLGAPRQSMAPTARGLDSGLGFELPQLQIPEFLKATADMEQAAGRAGLAIGDMGQATRLLSGEAGKFVGAIMSGGVVGGIVAGVGRIISGFEEAARRIEQAERAMAAAIDAYVDELAGLDQFQRLEQKAIEGAREVLQTFADRITAGIKSDKLREALEKQFDEAINSMDLEAIRQVLQSIGTDDALRVLAELERRMEEVNRLREEEAERIREQAEALERANAERRRQEIEAGRLAAEDIARGLARRDVELNGTDRELFRFDLLADAEAQIERLRELIGNGLSQDAFARLVATINDQVLTALDQFDEAARAAAEAAQKAAEAERFRQMVDTENLRIRLLVMRGMEEEAMALRQSLELLQAVEEGRSAEYLALLQQIHAEERAAAARNQATESIQRQTQAAQESARAIDGVARMLNGPAGFTFALYRNRVLRGQSDGFGGSVGGGSGGVRIDQVNVYAAPGQDPRAIAAEVIDALGGTVDRRLRAGGFNPLTQSREGF